MDIYFSVFNCHINNAKNKAIKIFKKKYGIRIFNKKIKPYMNGIMRIFQDPINKYTLFFCKTIEKTVNGDK